MIRYDYLLGLTLLAGSGCDTLWQRYEVPCTPGVDCPDETEMGAGDLGDLARPDDGGAALDSANPVYWIKALTGVTNPLPLRGIGGAGGQILAVGDVGTCLLSTDGKTWTALNTGNATDYSAVYASAANSAWLVGNGGARVYQYNGTNFTAGATIPGIAYTAVAGVSAAQIIAVGADNNLGAQYNTMAKWMAQDHNYNAKQRGMWGLAGGNRLWTVGETAMGGYFDVGQGKWGPKLPLLPGASTIQFTAIWGTSDTNVWAVGDQGSISHYAGASFAQEPSSSTVNLNGVWGLAANDIWAVGNTGAILHYDGTSWQPWTSKQDVGTDQLLAIWGDQTNLWTVSAQGNIFRYR